MTTILAVEVTAIDNNGVDVADGCRQVDNTKSMNQDVDRSIRAALSESLGSTLDWPLTKAINQAIRDAVALHFVNGWPRTIAPNHHAVMCYTTTDRSYKLRVTIDYEDESGFQ